MTVAQPLLDLLCEFKSPNVFNPWTDCDAMDISADPAWCRRLRLQAHFDVAPRFLLIGEAPGYQGCHFSGVPFTNEALVCEGLPRMDGWHRFTSRTLPWREPSATIIWGALREHRIQDSTVTWNAFAFHPHKPDEPYSNRAPTAAELLANRPILAAVLDRFSSAKVIAVGRVAERALYGLGAPVHATLRHPSMGGATEFRAGLAKLAAAQAVAA